MNLNDVIFLSNIPSIDLHGLNSDMARVEVLNFIKDNIILRNEIICIIHGVGSGILKKEVHNPLKKSKSVIDFKLFYNNSGCTIAKLKLD